MKKGQYKILVVEDNDDVRISTIELLEMYGYDCIEASDGRDGLEKAKENLPNIIVSDIMMPKMDGFEFTKKVIEDVEISHIPIILLTAKVKEEDKFEGLEHGAVDYLTKPFSSKELVLKVRNLIKSREDFKNSNWQSLLNNSFEDSELSEDEEFLKSLYDIIVTKIENVNFGVSELASELMLSERNLYRRVKVLTGIPVAAFIREIKLQRAKSLLETNQFNTISEVAYKVGFRSPKYFSKAFKKRFGVSPK
ncbi:MAG: response regulator [Balneola sp.]